mgnify:FL=1
MSHLFNDMNCVIPSIENNTINITAANEQQHSDDIDLISFSLNPSIVRYIEELPFEINPQDQSDLLNSNLSQKF